MLANLLLLIAISPGFFAWWQGRNLIRHNQQPLLAERYIHYWRSIYVCFLLVLGLLMFVLFVDEKSDIQPTSLTLTELIPLAIISLLIGGFSCRKTLLQEQWNLLGFLKFQLRWLAIFQSFPLLLLCTPSWIVSAGQNRVFIIVVLAALSYGLLFLNIEQIRKLLGVSTIAVPNMIARFDAISARSTAIPPYYLQLPMQGGRMANAFALPALPKPAVIFTETLLTELKSEEIDAIFAHELAHLEHMNGDFVHIRNLIQIDHGIKIFSKKS